GGEWFGKKGDALAEHTVTHDGVVGVAGHVEHPHVGPHRLEPLGELAAAHLWHHHVGDHELDGSAMALADVDGLRAVARLEHVVAVHLQDLPHHRADAQR